MAQREEDIARFREAFGRNIHELTNALAGYEASTSASKRQQAEACVQYSSLIFPASFPGSILRKEGSKRARGMVVSKFEIEAGDARGGFPLSIKLGCATNRRPQNVECRSSTRLRGGSVLWWDLVHTYPRRKSSIAHGGDGRLPGVGRTSSSEARLWRSARS